MMVRASASHDHTLKRVFLHRKLAQPRRHHVTDGDDPDKLTLLDNRHVAEPPLGHPGQHLIRTVFAPTADRVARHQVFHLIVKTGGPACRQRTNNVALRQNALDGLSVGRHDHPANPTLRKDRRHLRNAISGFDRDHLSGPLTLAFEYLPHQHCRSSCPTWYSSVVHCAPACQVRASRRATSARIPSRSSAAKRLSRSSRRLSACRIR